VKYTYCVLRKIYCETSGAAYTTIDLKDLMNYYSKNDVYDLNDNTFRNKYSQKDCDLRQLNLNTIIISAR